MLPREGFLYMNLFFGLQEFPVEYTSEVLLLISHYEVK